jgi:hypothetical protein
VKALADAVTSKQNIQAGIDQVSSIITELRTTFDKRSEAVISPDLLMDANNVPNVDLRALPALPTDSTSAPASEPTATPDASASTPENKS